MQSQRFWIIAFGFWFWLWPTADLDDGTLPLPLEENADHEQTDPL